MIFDMKTLSLVVGLSFVGPMASANQCSTPYFAGTLPEHEVASVKVSQLGEFLGSFPTAEGVKFDIDVRPEELWVDVVEYPGDVTVAAASRILFIIGRVADGEFGKLVLADEGEGIYQISEADIRAIGCQFVWGVEGRGQNAIALVRQLADNLEYYGTGQRVGRRFTGAPLGDTMAALDVLNNFINPNWVMRTVVIK